VPFLASLKAPSTVTLVSSRIIFALRAYRGPRATDRSLPRLFPQRVGIGTECKSALALPQYTVIIQVIRLPLDAHDIQCLQRFENLRHLLHILPHLLRAYVMMRMEELLLRHTKILDITQGASNGIDSAGGRAVARPEHDSIIGERNKVDELGVGVDSWMERLENDISGFLIGLEEVCLCRMGEQRRGTFLFGGLGIKDDDLRLGVGQPPDS